MNRPKLPVRGCDKHLTPLERETLTDEQKAHRMAELEWEEHQCIDAICDNLDLMAKRRRNRLAPDYDDSGASSNMVAQEARGRR